MFSCMLYGDVDCCWVTLSLGSFFICWMSCGVERSLVGLRLPGLQRLVGGLVAADGLEGQLVQERACPA